MPGNADFAFRDGQRAEFRGVRRQFVHRHPNVLRSVRLNMQRFAVQLDLPKPTRSV